MQSDYKAHCSQSSLLFSVIVMPHSPITSLIGFTSLLIIFLSMTITTTNLILVYRERVAKEELLAIGSSIAGQIVEAVSYASSSSTNKPLYFKISMPDECVYGHYNVILKHLQGKPHLVLKPIAKVKPEVEVSVPLSISYVHVEDEYTISSGAKWNYIVVTPIAGGIFKIEFKYLRGGLEG